MQLVSAPKACFPRAVPFTSSITALRQIADVFSKRPIRLEFKTPGFGFGKFLFRQCRFLRFAFPAPLLFELDLRRILAASLFSSDDCRGIDACVSDQLSRVVFLHNHRVNGIRNFFLCKNFERSGKRRF